MSIKFASRSLTAYKRASSTFRRLSQKRANAQITDKVTSITFEFVVVGGGGTGGGGDNGTYGGRGAGGGAGGYITGSLISKGFPIGVSSTIVVGGAGSAAGQYTAGGSGGTSTLTLNLNGTSGVGQASGGGGGGGVVTGTGANGKNGASGGGSCGIFWWNGSTSIACTAGTRVIGQGNVGALGTGTVITGGNPSGGGGGGAGGAASGATGGAGVTNSWFGSAVTYASGGNGGAATSATPNFQIFGHGGNGGSSGSVGQTGTTGCIMIRYPSSYPAAAHVTGSPSTSISGGYRIYIWNLQTASSITF